MNNLTAGTYKFGVGYGVCSFELDGTESISDIVSVLDGAKFEYCVRYGSNSGSGNAIPNCVDSSYNAKPYYVSLEFVDSVLEYSDLQAMFGNGTDLETTDKIMYFKYVTDSSGRLGLSFGKAENTTQDQLNHITETPADIISNGEMIFWLDDESDEKLRNFDYSQADPDMGNYLEFVHGDSIIKMDIGCQGNTTLDNLYRALGVKEPEAGYTSPANIAGLNIRFNGNDSELSNGYCPAWIDVKGVSFEDTGYMDKVKEEWLENIPTKNVWIQSGCDAGDGICLEFDGMSTGVLGIHDLSVLTEEGANEGNIVENTTAAESRIRDTDMASAMVEFSKNNILMQAGQSMLAQANQSTQGVLSLLQ